jgi:F-type H+-transporting ATPase subunit delta
MAAKRRLFVLPQLVATCCARIAADKGEVTAEVTSATALTKAQAEETGRHAEGARRQGRETENRRR